MMRDWTLEEKENDLNGELNKLQREQQWWHSRCYLKTLHFLMCMYWVCVHEKWGGDRTVCKTHHKYHYAKYIK